MARPRTYVLSGQNMTLANAGVTLAFINPGASQGFEVVRIHVSQSHSTTSGMQRLQLVRQVSTFPTLVSATPNKLYGTDDPASGIVGGTSGAAGTCGINASAEGAGAKTVLAEYSFNVLNGLDIIFTPEDSIRNSAGSASGFGVYLPAAAADLNGWNVDVTFKEI